MLASCLKLKDCKILTTELWVIGIQNPAGRPHNSLTHVLLLMHCSCMLHLSNYILLIPICNKILFVTAYIISCHNLRLGKLSSFLEYRKKLLYQLIYLSVSCRDRTKPISSGLNTMIKLCTVLMHACAWIIIPLVRAEADGNSMWCKVKVAADRVLPTCKYEYLLI